MSTLYEGDVDGQGRQGFKRARVLSPSASSASMAAEADATNNSTHERQTMQPRIAEPPAPPSPAQLQPVVPLPETVYVVKPVAQVVAPAAIYALPEKVAKRMKDWTVERIAELEQWASGTGDDEEEGEHGITIARGVTALKFKTVLGDSEKLPCKFALINGEVIIYEVPARPHSRAIMRIGYLIDSFNVNTANDTLITGTATRLTIGANNVLEPDLELLPAGLGVPPALADAAGNTFPTVVIEVAWSEAVISLHNLAPIYLGPNTSVQLYVAIKIYKRKPNQTFALLALLYSRANVLAPSLAVSCGTAPVIRGRLPLAIQPLLTGVGFGGPACNQAGLPAYQLPLPVASIYQGVVAPAGIPANFNLDLFEIQRQIFR